MKSPDLAVHWGPLRLSNPLVLSSGTHGMGEDGPRLFPPEILGAIVSKTVTVDPREGNPPPRVAETPCGMLNSIGLPNPGIDAYERDVHPRLVSLGVPVIVSIAGFTRDEYRTLAARVDRLESVAGIEVNVSCPNVERGGMVAGASPGETLAVLEAVTGETDRAVVAKLTPNVTDIVEIGQAAMEGGARMLSVINTLVGMSVDVDRRCSNLGVMTGGLSGPAIHPVGLANLWKLAKATGAPVLGGGGVVSAEGALAYLIAGASAVGIGTATFVDPFAPVHILEGIADYLERHEFASVTEVIGSLAETQADLSFPEEAC
ncbi:MAG: dihydroorotate dehydrogenase [Candidatus Eisenbacteria sp.]|nr:dihydroorotate dehydrogenase [Candidatus Eisenbacteria bacterium]